MEKRSRFAHPASDDAYLAGAKDASDGKPSTPPEGEHEQAYLDGYTDGESDGPSSSPLALTTQSVANVPLPELRRSVQREALASKRGKYVTADGHSIHVTRVGIIHSGTQRPSHADLLALAQIDKVIERARLVSETDGVPQRETVAGRDRDNKRTGVSTFHADVLVDGVPHIAEIVADRFASSRTEVKEVRILRHQKLQKQENPSRTGFTTEVVTLRGQGVSTATIGDKPPSGKQKPRKLAQDDAQTPSGGRSGAEKFKAAVDEAQSEIDRIADELNAEPLGALRDREQLRAIKRVADTHGVDPAKLRTELLWEGKTVNRSAFPDPEPVARSQAEVDADEAQSPAFLDLAAKLIELGGNPDGMTSEKIMAEIVKRAPDAPASTVLLNVRKLRDQADRADPVKVAEVEAKKQTRAPL